MRSGAKREALLRCGGTGVYTQRGPGQRPSIVRGENSGSLMSIVGTEFASSLFLAFDE